MARDFPPPEDEGGWPYLEGPAEVRDRAGLDWERLQRALRLGIEASGAHSFGVVVVRHGLLVQEAYAHNVSNRKRFDLWSCTKSFTSLAWGIALAESSEFSLDTPIYSMIPDAGPLSDPRKEQITVGHVLSMTSGIPGESVAVAGMPTRPDKGIFEYALGHAPNRLNQWVGTLQDEPGVRWDYSDPAFSHLSLAFPTVAGREIADLMHERVFAPLGVDSAWDKQGGGGFRGPHTNAHTGLYLSSRDFARIGHLLLRGGVWDGAQLVPRDWIGTATAPSQELNRSYGYGFWSNATVDGFAPGIPSDAFMLAGFADNRCYVVESADLVVVRTGTGSSAWNDSALLGGIIEAIL